jgi:hypothetical protein
MPEMNLIAKAYDLTHGCEKLVNVLASCGAPAVAYDAAAALAADARGVANLVQKSQHPADEADAVADGLDGIVGILVTVGVPYDVFLGANELAAGARCIAGCVRELAQPPAPTPGPTPTPAPSPTPSPKPAPAKS